MQSVTKREFKGIKVDSVSRLHKLTGQLTWSDKAGFCWKANLRASNISGSVGKEGSSVIAFQSTIQGVETGSL